jgi:hypothetical protein
MKLSKKPPKFTAIQKRVVIGLLAMYRRKLQIEDALSDLKVEIIGLEPVYAEIEMILDIMRIPYEWTERKAGKEEACCADWVIEKIIDHQGTPEEIYTEILAENDVWIPNDITPSDERKFPAERTSKCNPS